MPTQTVSTADGRDLAVVDINGSDAAIATMMAEESVFDDLVSDNEAYLLSIRAT